MQHQAPAQNQRGLRTFPDLQDHAARVLVSARPKRKQNYAALRRTLKQLTQAVGAHYDRQRSVWADTFQRGFEPLSHHGKVAFCTIASGDWRGWIVFAMKRGICEHMREVPSQH